jgi:DNA-binding transcriptional MerR regulator
VDEDMLSIGPFSAACGLSIRSLRHYDELGLLRPERVDESTGYRFYALAQLGDARAIRRLRDLELPLDVVAKRFIPTRRGCASSWSSTGSASPPRPQRRAGSSPTWSC